jgi:predicted DNA-binding protein (MmcQ/YjbR family)
VLIEAMDRLPARELEALLRQSYAMVSAKTKLKQPKSGARKKSRKPKP